MNEILTAAGQFINAFGLPTLISLVSIWIFAREVPKQRVAMAETAKENREANAKIAQENREANSAIATEYKDSIERLFARAESQIEKVTEQTTRLMTAAASAHAENVRRKDDRITDLTEKLIRKESDN